MDPHVSIQTTGSGVEGTSKRCTCIYIYLIRKASCAVQIIYLAVENYNIYQEIGGKNTFKTSHYFFPTSPKASFNPEGKSNSFRASAPTSLHDVQFLRSWRKTARG